MRVVCGGFRGKRFEVLCGGRTSRLLDLVRCVSHWMRHAVTFLLRGVSGQADAALVDLF